MTPAEPTGFTPRNLVIWGGAVIAALFLAMTAAGAVTQESAPGAALMLFPKNGFAYQNRALATSTGKTESIADLRVGPAQIADARAALAREPLASTAMTLLGIGKGNPDGADAVKAAHRMDKRQLIANGWLINHYGTQPGNHVGEVLALLDEALKVRPSLAQQYMPAFAQALVDADTISIFQRLLARNPGWEREFWRAVAANDAALPNGEVLRSRMLARNVPLGEADTTLMAAFLRAKRMDLALSYAKSLPVLPGDRDNLLRNSSFAVLPVMPPLDWELVSDGRISAAIDEGRGTLVLNAIAASGGMVARQLVALPPGEYALLVKLGRAELTPGSGLSVRVHCAESSDDSIPSFSQKVDGDVDTPFVVADDSRCRFYWVDLIYSALDSSGPASTTVAEVRIIHARVKQDTEAPAEKTEDKTDE